MLLGSSKTSWGSVPLPYDLTPLGMPGCTAYISGDVAVGVLNIFGRASLTFFLPQDANLLGQSFFAQGFVLDPATNGLGAIVSNAAESVIGN